MTMRRALEQSKNMVTARLLDGGVDKDPTGAAWSWSAIWRVEAKIYRECMKNYPFVLGAQALRMINLAGFYAAIANEGQRVTPYAIDSIEQNGKPVYRHDAGEAGLSGRGRPRRVLSASHHPRRRGGARHRGLDRSTYRLRRRQDRHHRQRERRLVRRLHQRRHRRGLGRLRQRRRQADAWPRRAPAARSPCRSSSRSSRRPGITTRRRRRCRRRRPRSPAISRRCRSTSFTGQKASSVQNGVSWSISASPAARSAKPSTRWSGAVTWSQQAPRPAPAEDERPALYAQTARMAAPVSGRPPRTLARTVRTAAFLNRRRHTQIGHGRMDLWV